MQSDQLGPSAILAKRARARIPGGTSTYSKRVDAFADASTFPSHIAKADGCRLTDPSGKVYIDYVAALGPIVLGYNNSRINARVSKQLERCMLTSLPPVEEVELAEVIAENIASGEMTRFFKTGAEAASAAVRLARTITGRDIVLSCGYHGWHDWYAAVRESEGVPSAIAALTRAIPYGDLDAAETVVADARGNLACIIVTPAMYGVMPSQIFLQGLRKLAADTGALLIFDEIITGFRWHLGGAQALCGVTPDLTVIGKAMANGMPLAALTGRRDAMSEISRTWVTSTYASEALSLAASLETIAILRETDAIGTIYRRAEQMCDGLRDVGRRAQIEIAISDVAPAVFFDLRPGGSCTRALNDAFIRECAARGVLIRRHDPGFSLCFMATHERDDISLTIELFAEALSTSLQSVATS